MRRTEVPEEFKTEDGITEPQLKFVKSLLDERDLLAGGKVSIAADEEYAAAIESLKDQASHISKRAASAWIERLLTLPHRPAERKVHRGGNSSNVPSPVDLPAGRYAIENNDGELRFYRLWRGTKNPNFVKLYVEHGPDQSEVPFRSALSIMAKIIEADPFTCARRYGAEIRSCSKCGRRLTNRVSRLLSIGPVCGGRWFSDGEDDSEWRGLVSRARDVLWEAGLDPSGDVEDSDNFDYSQEF